MHKIAVLGSTGSIGTSCLDVIHALPERLSLQGVAARSSWRILGQQSERFAPRWAVLSDASLREIVPRSAFSDKTELLFGPDAIERLAADPEIDVIVSGIVGAAGLAGTWAALEAGKRDCVANKETLGVAGPLVMRLARLRGAQRLPGDEAHKPSHPAPESGRA